MMNITRTFQGAIVLSEIANGTRIERQYIGYTLKEAKRLFREVVKKEGSERATFARYLSQSNWI